MLRACPSAHKKKRTIAVEGHSSTFLKSSFASDADMKSQGCEEAETNATEKAKPRCSTSWGIESRGECRKKRDDVLYTFYQQVNFACEE